MSRKLGARRTHKPTRRAHRQVALAKRAARKADGFVSAAETRRSRKGKAPRFSSEGRMDFLTRHHGALKRKGGRRPTPSVPAPYERPSRRPDENGKRLPKKRGFLKRGMQ